MLATRMRASGTLADIEITDDGSVAAPTSGAGLGTSTHTYESQTSTGPVSVLAISASGDPGDNSISGVTWNGNSMTKLVEALEGTVGASIWIVSGAQSGDIVISSVGAVDRGRITKISLANVYSLTPVDTDTESSGSGAANLDSLSSPGVGGIRIAMFVNYSNATGVTWTNATELSDNGVGDHRHSAAYDLGDDGTEITANGASDNECIAGVSIR